MDRHYIKLSLNLRAPQALQWKTFQRCVQLDTRQIIHRWWYITIKSSLIHLVFFCALWWYKIHQIFAATPLFCLIAAIRAAFLPFFPGTLIIGTLIRNITVEEAETVNELHLYRETLESSPIRLKGLNSFHDFRKSMGRTYSNQRKPFSFFDNLYGMFCLAFLVY